MVHGGFQLLDSCDWETFRQSIAMLFWRRCGLLHGPVAQLVEHRTFNAVVPGSSPGRLTTLGGLEQYTTWLVEAAGVEPASEKARHAKPTCVSGSAVSVSAYRTGKSGAHLVRLISALGSGPKPGAYPAK